MAKHTTGPWSLVFKSGAWLAVAGRTVAQVVAHDDVDAANALLIAAAQEMLGALREAEQSAMAVNAGAGVTLFNPATLEIVRDAIKRAQNR